MSRVRWPVAEGEPGAPEGSCHPPSTLRTSLFPGSGVDCREELQAAEQAVPWGCTEEGHLFLICPKLMGWQQPWRAVAYPCWTPYLLQGRD